MKIKTLIIEDEDNARQALKNMLEFYCPETEFTGEATDVAGGVKLLRRSEADLVFMDIHLPDGTGFDILKALHKHNFKLIFLTAYDEFALQAIKLSALDYILKPISPAELIRAIAKARESIENEDLLKTQLDTFAENTNSGNLDRKIILNAGSKLHFVEIKNIIRAEAQENFCKVIIKENEKILVSKSMKELEEMLVPSGFFRVHHSHLINLRQIGTFDKSQGEIVLNNKEKVPVSTRRRDSFMKALEVVF